MSKRDSESAYRLDEIDRRIIYELMTDARSNSAPKIAEAVGVSAGTIRSRIKQLEDVPYEQPEATEIGTDGAMHLELVPHYRACSV